VAVALGYLSSVLGKQTPMLVSFVLLMLLGGGLVLRRNGSPG